MELPTMPLGAHGLVMTTAAARVRCFSASRPLRRVSRLEVLDMACANRLFAASSRAHIPKKRVALRFAAGLPARP